MAQKCYGNINFTHSNFNLLTAIIISILLTAISICSRQFQFTFLAHLSRQAKGKLEEVFKARFLDFVNAFLSCLSSQNYIAKSGTIDVNQHVSFWLLNEKFVDRGF